MLGGFTWEKQGQICRKKITFVDLLEKNKDRFVPFFEYFFILFVYMNTSILEV